MPPRPSWLWEGRPKFSLLLLPPPTILAGRDSGPIVAPASAPRSSLEHVGELRAAAASQLTARLTTSNLCLQTTSTEPRGSVNLAALAGHKLKKM